MNAYRLFHNLSLDIVLGALGTSCMAARLFNAAPGWAWWLTLALTVWLLYMGDHILVAWKQRKESKRRLHLFIFRNRKILLWFMGVLGILDLFLIFNFLDRSLLKYAVILAVMVFLFYTMRHLFRKNRVLFVPGELFVLLLYMAGTWLGPFVTREALLQTPHALISIMFAGVLLMNLGVISLYDIHLDSRLGIASMVNTLGKKTIRNVLMVAGVTIYLLLILQFLIFGLDLYSQFALILSGMATIQFFVLLFPSLFRKNDYFRWTADAALFMGFLALLIR